MPFAAPVSSPLGLSSSLRQSHSDFLPHRLHLFLAGKIKWEVNYFTQTILAVSLLFLNSLLRLRCFLKGHKPFDVFVIVGVVTMIISLASDFLLPSGVKKKALEYSIVEVHKDV